jgi:acid phosphatase
MGSEVVFELYQKTGTEPGPRPPHGPRPNQGKGGFYVRVLFGGRVFKSSSPTLGNMDMIPVETLLGYFDELVGQNADKIKAKCT